MRRSDVWNQAPMMDACGRILQERFEQTGALDEIFNAIAAHQRAVQLTPDGHADMPGRLSNLGGSLLCRFEHTGNLTDISNAISVLQRAVHLTPDGHADMPSWLSNLGSSLARRFEHTGNLTDISNSISAHQKAVYLTPDGHADMPSRLSNLGGSLLGHFRRTCDLTDITNGISALQRAIHLTPEGDANMPTWLNNLGLFFSLRFEHTGDLTDVAYAISAYQKAIHLTPEGHVNMPKSLSNFGNSLLNRFKHTGDLADVANAISAHQRAVHLTPNGHANIPKSLSNLGNSFLRRFEHAGDLTDISNSISAHQRAVHLTPDGHAEMPGWLNNLGSSLLCRFERTGDPTDISNAISVLQRAIQLTPDGHADMPGLLSGLGTTLLCRFERIGNLADISNAISVCQRAIQLTPNGHADMPSQLNKLGASFWARFKRTGDSSNTTAATFNYRQSAIYKSGPPSVRLTAARMWARLSSLHNPPDSLKAHDVVVKLLSQIAGMDRTIQQRHSSLVDISMLTATAASAAFAQNEVDKALEWLEQGRCLVWSQLNQLRTPVDDLRRHNNVLADRFLHVSRALESSGSRQAFTPLVINGTMSQKIALEDEARTHIMLARDWNQLLQEIRCITAFSNFLRPCQASSIMKDLPGDGPIILINIHEDCCDALALILGCDKPFHIPLEHLTYKEASGLKDRLRKYLVSGNYLMRDADRGPREFRDPDEKGDLHEILEELWLRVVKPILDALSYSVGSMLTYNIQSHPFVSPIIAEFIESNSDLVVPYRSPCIPSDPRSRCLLSGCATWILPFRLRGFVIYSHRQLTSGEAQSLCKWDSTVF